jgi:ATP-dependent DNA helicase RecG
LNFFPRDYEDRSQVATIAGLTDGTKATLTVKVLSQRQIPIQKLGRSMLEVRCTDETGQLGLKWFYPPRGMEKRFVPGVQIVVTGKVKYYLGRPEIVHPEITWGASGGESDDHEAHPDLRRVVPIYVEIEGVPSRTFRKVLWEAVEKYSHLLKEDLPDYLLQRRKVPSIVEAVKALHFPPDHPDFQLTSLAEFNTPAHRRLIYGEFFKFEYLILRQKLNVERASAVPIGRKQGMDQVLKLTKMLPFLLTQGQNQSLRDILEDFSQSHPMNRLIQGDVGSGKTVIAFLSAGCVLSEGGQATLMAPTEILAEQHYKNAIKLFKGELNAVLLTGKSTPVERIALQKRLSLGEPILVIGTHALLEDSVVFKNLQYVMIDEQHRFGVEQRRTLRQKGIQRDASGKLLLPHSLILTATPIPRTLALTAFGDLDVTSIRDLPPGRSAIKTQVVRDSTHRARVYRQIRKELESGRQAYFIYPLVNESEAEGFTQLKSAVVEAEKLAQDVFPDFLVGLLHGQMKSEEKAAVMDRFQKGEIRILVSTTVIEVGVDVPNSTVMAIEHAERFGLSQLHQLRGRVGRGQFQSYCYLFSKSRSGGTTSARLEVLEETGDGFKIAEADLEIRGPGEFLGTRQAGGLPFRLANLVRDRELLLIARDDATEIMRADPDLIRPEHLSLRQYYEREGGIQFERLKTS